MRRADRFVASVIAWEANEPGEAVLSLHITRGFGRGLLEGRRVSSLLPGLLTPGFLLLAPAVPGRGSIPPRRQSSPFSPAAGESQVWKRRHGGISLRGNIGLLKLLRVNSIIQKEHIRNTRLVMPPEPGEDGGTRVQASSVLV